MEAIGIFAFIVIIFIILFPSIGILGGTAFSTIGVLLLVPCAAFIDKDRKIYKKKDIRYKFLNITVIFAVLQFVAAIGSAMISVNSSSTFSGIKWTIMLPVYAYVFSCLSSVKEIRHMMKIAIVLSGLILGLYSIYSYVTQSNVYVDFFEQYFKNQEVGDVDKDYSNLRGISHRVYGNVNNPVFFSGELMMLLGFCCYIYMKMKSSDSRKLSLLFIMLVIFVGCIFTGSKSGLIPSLLFLFITLFYSQLKKHMVKTLLAISVTPLIVLLLNNIFGIDYETFFMSLNPFNEEVGGSSFGSRMEEFAFLAYFVGGNYIFGNGLGWGFNYYMTYGAHPILHTFESLIMSSFVDMGLWGLLIVYPYFMLSNYTLGVNKNVSPSYRILLIGFYFFAIVTGLGMIKFFYLWQGIILCDYNDEINNKHKILSEKSMRNKNLRNETV